MKKILISIRPQWVAKILNGEKTLEIRKTFPKCELPCEVYIYCTKGKLSLNLWTSKTKEKCRKAILEYNESQADEELDEFINAEFVERYPKYRGERVIFSPQTLNGKVVAKFTLNKVEEIERYTNEDFDIHDHFFEEYGTSELEERELLRLSCLSKDEISEYLKFDKYGRLNGYAWHIDNLVIFDKPKELEEFEFPNPSGVRYIGQRAIKGLPSKKRPPQSWCYCEAEE